MILKKKIIQRAMKLGIILAFQNWQEIKLDIQNGSLHWLFKVRILIFRLL